MGGRNDLLLWFGTNWPNTFQPEGAREPQNKWWCALVAVGSVSDPENASVLTHYVRPLLGRFNPLRPPFWLALAGLHVQGAPSRLENALWSQHRLRVSETSEKERARDAKREGEVCGAKNVLWSQHRLRESETSGGRVMAIGAEREGEMCGASSPSQRTFCGPSTG